jgi:hypothetical protein
VSKSKSPRTVVKINPCLVVYNNPEQGLVVMLDNNEFDTPAIWGIVVADIVQHLVNAYVKDGMSAWETRQEILSMFMAEVQKPTAKAKRVDAEWEEEGFIVEGEELGGEE